MWGGRSGNGHRGSSWRAAGCYAPSAGSWRVYIEVTSSDIQATILAVASRKSTGGTYRFPQVEGGDVAGVVVAGGSGRCGASFPTARRRARIESLPYRRS